MKMANIWNKYKKHTKPAIITMVVLVIPYLYVLFFLKAFWNPYSNISSVPVGVVNLDTGDFGREIVKKLEESNMMEVVLLDNDEKAVKMLKDREFFSSITIPENFTENVMALKPNTIIFRSNKKYNYIASQIYKEVSVNMTKTLKTQIANTIAEKLHMGIADSTTKMVTLNDGLSMLKSGSAKLESGISMLDIKYKEFDDGLNTLSKGSKDFAKGLDQYIAGVNKSAEGLDQISKGVIQLGDKVKVLSVNKDFKRLYEGAKKVQDEKIKDELIKAGAKLSNGSGQILAGGDKLLNASTKVKDGLSKLEDGSRELKAGLETAYGGVNGSVKKANNTVISLKGLAKYMDNSVNLKVENIDDVPNYGTVFAAYFMSISLWVGCLVLIVVLYYDAKNRFGLFVRTYQNKYKQYASYLGLILIQGPLLTLLVTLSFDFTMVNIPVLLLCMTITDLAFFSMIYFFVLVFDDFGKFISVLLLIVQISASEGTFPIQTTPVFFQKIFSFIPMRYSVSLFKEAFAGFDSKFFTSNFIFLVSVFVVFSFLTWIIIRRDNRKEEIE